MFIDNNQISQLSSYYCSTRNLDLNFSTFECLLLCDAFFENCLFDTGGGTFTVLLVCQGQESDQASQFSSRITHDPARWIRTPNSVQSLPLESTQTYALTPLPTTTLAQTTKNHNFLMMARLGAFGCGQIRVKVGSVSGSGSSSWPGSQDM